MSVRFRAAPWSQRAAAAEEAPRPARRRRGVLQTILRDPKATPGLLILLAIVFGALLGPSLVPYSPNDQALLDRLQPPFWTSARGELHLLGTDHLGRDILARTLAGARISLLVAVLAVVLSGVLGVTLGLLAGYYRGWVDSLVMRLVEVQLALPFVLLAATLVAIVGINVGNLIVVLGLTSWVAYARLTRAQVLSLREREFVEAARAIGAPASRIISRHIFPNTVSAIIVVATFSAAQMIVAETALSFLGLGVPLSIPSWGSMLAEGRNYLTRAWWLATLPGVAITLTVIGVNLLGDWLRDYLDPRLRL